MKLSNLRLLLTLWGFALALAGMVIVLMVLRGPAIVP